jgi:hypothetical protein
MAEKHVVFALRHKYARLKGELASYATPDPEATMHAIAQVGAVLHMFKPDEDLSAIKPVRPCKGKGFRGRWTRPALAFLRSRRRPMTARELARLVMTEQGLDVRDTLLITSVETSLHQSLERLEGHGLTRVSNEPKRWARTG